MLLDSAGPGSTQEEVDEDEYDGFYFNRHFLPIGQDGSGGYLFVDLRDGLDYGTVGLWNSYVDWEPENFYWRSVTDMLTELRDALVYGKPGFLGYALRRVALSGKFRVYRASINDSQELEWNEGR